MSGMTQDEIVDVTGYPADLVLRILQDAGISEAGTGDCGFAGLPEWRRRIRLTDRPN